MPGRMTVSGGARADKTGSGYRTDYALASAGSSLLAGTENGLCRSEDGHDWRAAGLSSMRVSAVEADPDDDGKWYAGGSPGGLWMTKDEGKSWLGIPEIGNDVEVISAPGGTS